MFCLKKNKSDRPVSSSEIAFVDIEKASYPDQANVHGRARDKAAQALITWGKKTFQASSCQNEIKINVPRSSTEKAK